MELPEVQARRAIDEITVQHIVSEISDHVDFSWDGTTSGRQERESVAEIIKAALRAERLSATERAAMIAEEFREPNPFPTVYGAIAAAIRSQDIR